METAGALLSQLEERGYKGRIVSTRHVRELHEEIERHYSLNSFDEEFYRESLGGFVFTLPCGLPQAKSLVVVAVPQPQLQVTFHRNGKSHSLIIPPTYLCCSDRQVESILANCLNPHGYHVLKAVLPLKLLAVRSGLGKYGKNNICYVPQMGSFHRLTAFYTDLPCSEDTWQRVEMLKNCHDCSACVRGCPTGAISSDRFLLRAERCITFYNERKGDFPGWMSSSWHNALVGCLYCQKVCPLNRPFLQWVEFGGDFSEKETALLLREKSLDRLPSAVATKLRHLDLVEYLDVLGRNLSVLLTKEKGS